MTKYLKVFIVPGIYFISLPVILTIFNLFKIIIPSSITMILTSIILFISSYKLSIKVNKKILMHTSFYGLIIVFILFMLSLITKSPLNIMTLIYYAVLLLSCILGGIFYTIKKDN